MSSLLALDQQLCLPLYAASRAVIRAYGPLLDELGLTYPQYLVMLALWEEEPLQVRDLGARLHLDSGTLTPLLKRLEAAGLVDRARDPEDERRVWIRPTKRGRALRAKAEPVPVAMACKVGLSPAELRSLRKSLESVLVALEG